MRILHTLPPRAQDAIVASLTPEERARYQVGVGATTRLETRHSTPSPHPRAAEATQQFHLDAPDNFRGDLHGDHVADLPQSDWQEGS